jgi:mRNA interferase HigB
MRIISKAKLREFWQQHPDAVEPLRYWHKVVKAAKWQSFADVRKTFASADSYKTLVIFNIAGNKYRLVAKIEYRLSIVFIGKVITHTEYSKDKWKDELL